MSLYLVGILAAIPGSISIYFVKEKYILWFAIMVTIHNGYWIMSFGAWDDENVSTMSIPVLIVSIPLNVMLFVIYKKLKTIHLDGEDDMMMREYKPNYNSNNNEVDQWLNDIGLGQYRNTFVDNGIDDESTIMTLSKEDLAGIGVKLGHRNKIMKKIRKQDGGGTRI